MTHGHEGFGFSAEICIAFEGSIEDLANLLSEKLALGEFYIDNQETPPHDLFACWQISLFQTWLMPLAASHRPYAYEFSIESADSILHEHLTGKMHNVSPWLARVIAKFCKLETCVFHNGVCQIEYAPGGEPKMARPSPLAPSGGEG